ncbi:MAG: HU family DNA-binding protein [Oscillospiraceae bacterium]|nr:HU family DNA-binding protein [Oscillospiraceae bacterium]
MNKIELIAEIAAKTGLTKKDTEKAVSAAVDAISAELRNGGSVKVAGFGNFTVKEKAERKARNPRTGEEVIVPASKAVQFRPAKALKDTVEG